jgi:hypothetical protein
LTGGDGATPAERRAPNGVGVVDHLRRPPYLPDIDPFAGMKVMKGFMIAMMNPSNCGFMRFEMRAS